MALYGHPTAAELVEARRTASSPTRSWRRRRAASNSIPRVDHPVLETVARQLRRGEAYAAAHTERLAGLGYATDRELVDAIRAGTYDASIGELAATLEPDVRAKLEIWNPRYMD